jgi:hypothetical protein
MQIPLIEPPNDFCQTLYFGQRTRFPSATDVDFVSETRIVAAHRYGCKLYVIDFNMDEKSFSIVHTHMLTHNGSKMQTEMIKVVGNKVYVICYSDLIFEFELVSDGTLVKQRSKVLNDTKTPYHGIEFFESHLYLTPSNKSHGDDRIVKLNPVTFKHEHLKSLGSKFRYKDIGFLENRFRVIPANYKNSVGMTTPGSSFNGIVYVYNERFERTDARYIELAHFDAITTRGNEFFVTVSDRQGGAILHGTVGDSGTIDTLRRIPVEDFPHGINIFGSLIAYTSYETSALYIHKLFEFTDPERSHPFASENRSA